MKIAYMHFHLKTGGVTTVIKHQVRAASNAGCQVLVVCGQAPQGGFPAKVLVVPGLGYDRPGHGRATARDIVESIRHALYCFWPQGPDLIHVHNPTLAKNSHLQTVLKYLQASGLKILCQIHDFAEDGRPSILFADDYLSDCHYAVLNGRDMAVLSEAGLVSDGLHYLPNPVCALPSRAYPALPADSNHRVLYPVRAIRRKNIGEALLLSLFFAPDQHLAITLPPNSPSDVHSYNFWRAFSKQYHLPIKFEAGVGADFNSLLQNSHYILTTSVSEGFGYAFLEPWVHAKALWGRLLPDICTDFMQRGVHLDHLYTRLAVPLKWIDAGSLKKRWQQAYLLAAGHFNVPLSRDQCDAAWHRICADDQIDAGMLDELFQLQLIMKLLSDSDAMNHLKKNNPFLRQPGPPQVCSEAYIEQNRRNILQHYNHECYAHRLIHIYQQVLSVPVRHAVNKKCVQAFFLDPNRFSLLKWGTLDLCLTE